MNNNFNPNYAIPPCVFIKEEMKVLKISKRKLAKLTGFDKRTIKNLLKGTAIITNERAEKLGEVLYSSKQYWLNLQDFFVVAVRNKMLDICGVPREVINDNVNMS